MTLVLSNDEIGELLTMPDCLSRLEEAYRDLADGRAVTRPRSDLYGPEAVSYTHLTLPTNREV